MLLDKDRPPPNDSIIILGLVGPGFALTIAVLGLYAYLAWNPLSRKHLDRVSFRLLVYALVAHVVFGATFPIGTLAAYPGWRCNLLAFLINLSLMFSAGMFFCMALNLPLVLVHKLNGQRMEKYYILGTAIICGACNGSAYASGNLGWDAVNGTCWYRSSDSGAMLRWLIGTQTFWILLVSLGEVVAFLTIVGYLIGYELITRRFRAAADGTGTQFSETSQTPGSTIQMFRSIILRIGLYPLVSCLLNISTSILDLHEMRHGEQTQLNPRVDLADLAIYSARPLIYGILAATDPSFIRAMREQRHPGSTHSNYPGVGAGAAPGCLSTVIEMTAAERNANDRMSTYGREEGLESLGDAARTAVNSPTHSQGEEKILSDKDGMESATASASEKRHSQMADVVFHSI